MPVQIGASTHSFSEPTGLLSDCHRRIEMFLESLERVGAVIDYTLAEDVRTALESALRYFREAAPKHTADEEQSLFPRLRELQDNHIDAALKALEPLEQQHRRAYPLHAEIDWLGRRCLEGESLSSTEVDRFRQAVAELTSMYKEHIRIEDELVFPLAGRLLSQRAKDAIATEMAARRQ